MEFQGVYVPVITPFTSTYQPDLESFKQALEYLLSAEVEGIVIGGTTGEFYALDTLARAEQLKDAKQLVDTRAKLIAGVTDMRPQVTIELGILAKDLGYDAIMLAAPPYILPNTDNLAEHVNTVSHKIGLPVMLYNYPGRTGVMMDDKFLKKVATNPSIVAIKESSGDMSRLDDIPKIAPEIQICCGKDDESVGFFAKGSKAWVCAASNIIPHTTQKIYKLAVLENDISGAQNIMSEISELMDLLENSGNFQQIIKLGTAFRGLGNNSVSPPLYQNTDLLDRLTPLLKLHD